MSILTLSGQAQESLLDRSGVAKNYIVPAATFTSTTPSSASGGTKTTLTSAGAHGLTSAVAVGKNLYITAGTGWTAGYYNISSIDLDTTGVAVTIDVAFDAGFGTPTIALANTSAVFATIAVPPLSDDSIIEIDASWTIPNNANQKFPEVKLGATTFFAANVANVVLSRPSSVVIQNRGSTGSQVSAFTSGSPTQNSTSTSAITTGSIDTSVATTLTIGGRCVNANDYIILERYLVKYWI